MSHQHQPLNFEAGYCQQRMVEPLQDEQSLANYSSQQEPFYPKQFISEKKANTQKITHYCSNSYEIQDPTIHTFLHQGHLTSYLASDNNSELRNQASSIQIQNEPNEEDTRVHPHNKFLFGKCNELINMLEYTKSKLLNPNSTFHYYDFLKEFNRQASVFYNFQNLVEMDDALKSQQRLQEIQLQQQLLNSQLHHLGNDIQASVSSLQKGKSNVQIQGSSSSQEEAQLSALIENTPSSQLLNQNANSTSSLQKIKGQKVENLSNRSDQSDEFQSEPDLMISDKSIAIQQIISNLPFVKKTTSIYYHNRQ